MLCCASCGVAQVDDIKLYTCPACDLLRYCSGKCQQEHRPQHEQACKERAAELRDEILFRQPESSHLGDCPICLLPLPIDPAHSSMYPCCCKMICNGCVCAQRTRDREENLQHKCPFCRQYNLDTPAEVELVAMKRVKANDPVALRQMGACRYREGDYDTAFEYWTKAVELGDVDAHFKLSTMYEDGIGVEKDEKKELHYLTEAAISGHPGARYNLASYEGRRGRYERAAKHLIIAANLGHAVHYKN